MAITFQEYKSKKVTFFILCLLLHFYVSRTPNSKAEMPCFYYIKDVGFPLLIDWYTEKKNNTVM